MRIEIPYGERRFPISIDETGCDLVLARSRNPAPSRTWEEAVAEALAAPLGTPPLAAWDLKGKRIAVITDDRTRPTPAYRVLPQILEVLHRAGARDEGITFITASGMHDPMSKEELERKLGTEVVARYRCVAHDAGDPEMLRFVGISPMGTHVWMNRFVVEADVRIGLGRVCPHATHGYEGGYKLLLPGVAGFDSILRNHSFNFSERSVPGVHRNLSRMEADNIGRLVGIDFLVNVVVNDHSEPIRAFGGAVELVHEAAIEFGDREVWGAAVGDMADIVIASHGTGPVPAAGFDAETLRRACAVARIGGLVIVPTERDITPLPDGATGETANDAALDALPNGEFGPALRNLALSELLRLHERRDWPLSRRETQTRLKAIRGEFYRRRMLLAAAKRRVRFTPEPQHVLDEAIASFKEGKPHVVLLPEGRTTLPKIDLYRASVDPFGGHAPG